MTRYTDIHISVDLVREYLTYCPETGCITWKKSPGRSVKAGATAGKTTTEGYIRIGFSKKCLCAHRIAWALHYGMWPNSDLDHINRIKSDNRIANLRLATASKNNANRGIMRTNTHGAKGVTQLPSGSWQAQIQFNHKNRYLGAFRSKAEAMSAYAEAAIRFFGAFAPEKGH
jgi:hypothetical protein